MSPTEDRSLISDGYHTFAELYEHRHALMLALMRCQSSRSWYSRWHEDGKLPFDSTDWFIVGIDLPTKTITYHLPTRLWSAAVATGATELPTGKPWDGHTPVDVVSRLIEWHELGELTRSCMVSSPRPKTVLPFYQEDDDLKKRLATCIEHELGHGGNYLAAAASIIRDVGLGYIKFATTPQAPEPESEEVKELVQKLDVIAAQLVNIDIALWGKDAACVARAATLVKQQAAELAALKAKSEREGSIAADLLPANPPNIPTTMAMQYRSAWREGVDDGWNEARATLTRWNTSTTPPAPVPKEAVAIPCNADVAVAMTLLGEAYLREHAPERLRSNTLPAPKPGEVGELVEWLRNHALDCHDLGINDWAAQSTRAADLLQDLSAFAPSVAPVAVSEQPWEWEEWCDEQERCWAWSIDMKCWQLLDPRILADWVLLLPADAIALPAPQA